MLDDRGSARYPHPAITPAEFEQFVAGELLGAAGSEVADLVVTPHEKITGVDGAYDFDTTVRYRFAGMAFLVIVEAKLHRNPIKREQVQVLQQKIHSVGAHKSGDLGFGQEEAQRGGVMRPGRGTTGGRRLGDTWAAGHSQGEGAAPTGEQHGVGCQLRAGGEDSVGIPKGLVGASEEGGERRAHRPQHVLGGLVGQLP